MDNEQAKIINLKAQIFDLMKSRELLQFSINKINQDVSKRLKELDDLEKPAAKPKPAEEGK